MHFDDTNDVIDAFRTTHNLKDIPVDEFVSRHCFQVDLFYELGDHPDELSALNDGRKSFSLNSANKIASNLLLSVARAVLNDWTEELGAMMVDFSVFHDALRSDIDGEDVFVAIVLVTIRLLVKPEFSDDVERLLFQGNFTETTVAHPDIFEAVICRGIDFEPDHDSDLPGSPDVDQAA